MADRTVAQNNIGKIGVGLGMQIAASNKPKKKKKNQGTPAVSRQDAQGQFDRDWDAKGFSGEKAKSRERMDAQAAFNKRWDKKTAGRIVPTGGETPLGLYDGKSGQLLKAAKRSYSVQSRDKNGKVSYAPAFDVDRHGELKARKDSGMKPGKYYEGMYELAATPLVSQPFRDKIIEEYAKEQNGDLPTSPWRTFTDHLGDIAPLKWAWSTFTTVTGNVIGGVTNALEVYDRTTHNPWTHKLATAVTAANWESDAWIFKNDKPGMDGWLEQVQKADKGTYGLDSYQAMKQHPLLAGLARNIYSGGQISKYEREAYELSRTLDPANPADHAAINDWNNNTLLGKTGSAALTTIMEFTIGDELWVAGKGAKALKAGVRGSKYLTTLGKDGFVGLVDAAVKDLGDDAVKVGRDSLLDTSKLPASYRKSAEAADDAFEMQQAGKSVSELTPELKPLNNAQRRRAAKAERKINARKQSMMKDIEWLAKQTDVTTISQHHLIKDSTYGDGLAGILVNANDYESVALVLKASVGDAETMRVLKETRAYLGNTINNMHRHSEWLGKFKEGKYTQIDATDASHWIGKYDNIEDERAAVTKYLDDLRKQEEEFAKLTDVNLVGSLVPDRAYSGTAGVSRFSALESHRLRRAEKAGELAWDTQVWRKNPFETGVRIVRWAGRQKPNNWVQYAGVSDVNSAGPAVRAWLQSSDQAIIPPAMRAALYGKYADAVGKGDAHVLQALDEIEQDVMMAYALHHGKGYGVIPDEIDINQFQHMRPLTEEAKPAGPIQPLSEVDLGNAVVRQNVDNYADSLRRIDATTEPIGANTVGNQLEGIDKRRNVWNERKTDTNVGSKAVYEGLVKDREAAVKAIKESDQEVGRVIERWVELTQIWQRKRDFSMKQLQDRGGYYVDEDGMLSMIPGWESQLAGSRPMIDLKKFGHVAAGTNKKLSVKTMDALGVINSGAQQLFRPLVLLSFKYTLRNNFEAQLRALAVTGASTYDPRTIQAMGLNAVNKAKRFVYGKKDTKKAEAALAQTLNGEDGILTVRNALQADLDSLAEHMSKDDIEAYMFLIKHMGERYQATTGKSIESVFPQYPPSLGAAGRKRAAGVLDAYKQQIDSLDAQAASLQPRIDEVARRRETMDAPRQRAGSYDMTFGSVDGEPLVVPGMLSPGPNNPAADAMLNNLSADETASMIFNLRHDARDRAYRSAMTRDNAVVRPDNKGYWHSMAHAVNNYLGRSEMAKMQLRNAPVEEFIKFIRESPDGKGVRDFANQHGKNLHDTDALKTWYEEGARRVQAMIPDEKIRMRIVDGDRSFSADELKATMGHYGEEGKLVPISGAEVVADHGLPSGDGLWNRWRRAAQTGFEVLGSTPESNLARYPMGTALYKKHIAKQVQFHGEKYVMENMDSIVRQAQRAAVRDVKEVQYTVERYSNLAAMLEPVAPFIQAKINSMRVWSKLIGNDPSLAARAAQLWELTDKTVDLNTGEWANTDAPVVSDVFDFFGLSDRDRGDTTRFNIQNIWTILLQNNPQVDGVTKGLEGKEAFDKASATSFILGNLVPNFGGPWVSPTASEIYKATAGVGSDNWIAQLALDTMEGISGYLSPAGASNSFMSWETIAPAVLKSFERQLKGEGSDAFNATAMAIHADRMTRWYKDGREGAAPTYAESVDAARAVYKWDMIFQMTSPFGAPENRTAFDPIRDEIKSYYDMGMTSTEVRQKVYEKFGFDYAPLIMPSQDKFGGIPATKRAVEWLRNNEDLVARYLGGSEGGVTDPQTASQRMYELKKLIPELQADGTYDSQAVSLLRTMNIPGMNRQWYDAFEAPGATMETNLNVQRGWRAQNQMDAVFDQKKAEIEAKYPGRNERGSSDKKKFWNEYTKLLGARDSTIMEMRSTYKEWAIDSKYFSDDPTKQIIATGILTQLKSDPKLWEKVRKANPEYVETVETFMDFRNRKIIDIKRAGNAKDLYDKEAQANIKLERARYEWGVNELKKKNTQFADMFKSFFQSELYQDGGPAVASDPDVWVPRIWTKDERKKRKAGGRFG